ncbi:mitochondria-localized glutamic acid-rich protein, transcript variant X1 [Columba livia]|uniref:Mitochondria-localized glutamic acid-rich protein, transcript variant X1 n=1 Tax=Columba livia TaxID=8932 RepID=A0A2I0MGX5_COLLI|nr:mitochondria-localized glutamic acid-rich protein, transcript variant X1 [Columba livia]
MEGRLAFPVCIFGIAPCLRGVHNFSGETAQALSVPHVSAAFCTCLGLLFKCQAPLRQMASGSVPGSSGETMIYYLLAGAAAFGGLFYAYRVVSSSRSNYIEHMNILQERAQSRKGRGDEEEMAEVTEGKTATDEADAVAAVGPAAQDESSGVSPETGEETDLPAPEASPAVEEAQQEPAANVEVDANSEAAAVQETVSEVLDVTAASAQEENSDAVEEGVASAAQEISDTPSGNQDIDAEESGRTSEVSVEDKTPEEVAKEP